MIFLKPDYLTFMVIPLVVLFYFIVTGKSKAESIFDEKILKKLTIDDDSLGRTGRNMMLFSALFLMIIALARPALPKEEVKTAVKSIDILIALDISKSMLCSDLYPNRLIFAKRKITELLDKFKEANAAVIAFADEGFLVSPLTQDRNTLGYLIKNLDSDSLSTNGTNLLVPITRAVEFLKRDSRKILIIFTDGGDKKNFSLEIKEAKKNDIAVYIYATATKKGGAVTYLGEKLKDKDGNIVITKLNEDIKKLSFKSGGAYIEGGYKDDSIDLIIKDIKDRFEINNIKNKKIKEYRELFYYPLSLAILFMLFSFGSLPKRSTPILAILIVIFLQNPSKAGIFDFADIKKGFKEYKNENFNEALVHFKKVAESKKDAPSVYDLANAYYKTGRYQKAINAYKSAKSDDGELKYKILFNLGNAYYKIKSYEKALASYERAKKIKTQPDLLHNIELAKKHLKKESRKNQNRKKRKEEEKKQNDRNDQDKKRKEQKSQNSSNDAQKMGKKNGKRDNKEKKESFFNTKEMKKWEKKLQKSRPKTMPIRFKNQKIKRVQNENPW